MDNIEDICNEFMPIVKLIAKRLHKSLPANAQLDDLIGDGNVALVMTAERHKGKSKAELAALIRVRVEGAMRDGLRRDDILTVRQRRKAKRCQTPDDMYWDTVHNCSIDNIAIIADQPTPEDICLDNEYRDIATQAMLSLSLHERNIITMRYGLDKAYHTIGEEIGMSRTGTHALHNRVVSRLREIVADLTIS